ncbi:hypothetical protein HanPI659440_Chr16g0634711 [Helianthus annuus]|nr:hypothetical protein HanPI659440_Chr16g0634711 [Helianthus annuus]
MDVEKKVELPLTTIITDDKRKRRRCICLSIIIAAILLVALTILILALTAFKPKKPITTVNSVAVKDLDATVNLLPPRVSLNVTLDLDITIKNPNKVAVKFLNSSATLLYKGQVVDRLLANVDVYADIIRGNLPVSTYTRISELPDG